MTAEFPNFLRVGAAHYRVRYISAKEAEDRKINGECKPNERLLEVQADLPLDLKLEVLIHEALHASFYESQLTDLPREKLSLDLSSPEGHEFFVSWSAAAFLRLVNDNPCFLGLLLDLRRYIDTGNAPAVPHVVSV